MGRITQGILGPVSGKVGGTVGSSWKGIAVLKGYQPKVSNPRTALQIDNRSLMSNVVAFAQAILATVIKPCWDRFASKMSGYNAFVSANKALFVTALPSSFSALKTSIGKMAATVIDTLVVDASDAQATLTWVNDAGQGFKLDSDTAYVVVINETKGWVEGFNTSSGRISETLVVSLQGELDAADVCHAYLTFLRADGSVVSNNSYKTANAIA